MYYKLRLVLVFIETVSEMRWFNLEVISEAVACGAVELYYEILQGVSNLIHNPHWYKWGGWNKYCVSPAKHWHYNLCESRSLYRSVWSDFKLSQYLNLTWHIIIMLWHQYTTYHTIQYNWNQNNVQWATWVHGKHYSTASILHEGLVFLVMAKRRKTKNAAHIIQVVCHSK